MQKVLNKINNYNKSLGLAVLFSPEGLSANNTNITNICKNSLVDNLILQKERTTKRVDIMQREACIVFANRNKKEVDKSQKRIQKIANDNFKSISLIAEDVNDKYNRIHTLFKILVKGKEIKTLDNQALEDIIDYISGKCKV